jgi:CRP/FNR family transcriptional regulator, cyclic AMP receptor protein
MEHIRNARGHALTQERLSPYRGDVGDWNGTNKKECNLLIGSVGNSKVYNKSDIVFGQGNPADSIFYVIDGMIRLNVISTHGKEGIVGLLGAGDFLGEGSIAGLALRVETATAMTYSRLVQIDKAAMTFALHQNQRVCDLFISSLVTRNVRIEEDLIELLFNSTEKRLARALLLLCPLVSHGLPKTAIHGVSQEILAEMVGTRRSRVNIFMNRFRHLGFIDYEKDEIRVHRSLQSVLSTDG